MQHSHLTPLCSVCAVKKTLAKKSNLENNGFRIILRIQEQQLDVEMIYVSYILWLMSSSSSTSALRHRGKVWRVLLSTSRARYLWMAPGGVDSHLKLGLHCHHTSHAGDAAGSRRFATACIKVDSWTPFCRTPAELLLFRQQIESCCYCCPPLDPVEGPGGCRCFLRLPHTTALYHYLLQ